MDELCQRDRDCIIVDPLRIRLIALLLLFNNLNLIVIVGLHKQLIEHLKHFVLILIIRRIGAHPIKLTILNRFKSVKVPRQSRNC